MNFQAALKFNSLDFDFNTDDVYTWTSIQMATYGGEGPSVIGALC